MTERITVKPTPFEIDGKPVPRKVRKPIGTYLAAEGEAVNLDTYWLRKIDADEVERIEDVLASDAVAKSKPAKQAAS